MLDSHHLSCQSDKDSDPPRRPFLTQPTTSRSDLHRDWRNKMEMMPATTKWKRMGQRQQRRLQEQRAQQYPGGDHVVAWPTRPPQILPDLLPLFLLAPPPPPCSWPVLPAAPSDAAKLMSAAVDVLDILLPAGDGPSTPGGQLGDRPSSKHPSSPMSMEDGDDDHRIQTSHGQLGDLATSDDVHGGQSPLPASPPGMRPLSPGLGFRFMIADVSVPKPGTSTSPPAPTRASSPPHRVRRPKAPLPDNEVQWCQKKPTRPVVICPVRRAPPQFPDVRMPQRADRAPDPHVFLPTCPIAFHHEWQEFLRGYSV